MRLRAFALLILFAWLFGCATYTAPSFVHTYAAFAKRAATTKPIAAVNMGGRWSTELTDATGTLHPAWAKQFQANDVAINAQTVFDRGSVFVVILQDKAAPLKSDSLTRMLGLERQVQKMKSQNTGVTIQDKTTFGVFARWPFLRWTKRRYVLVFVDGGLSKYRRSCHADLVTAWAAASETLDDLVAQCQLSQ